MVKSFGALLPFVGGMLGGGGGRGGKGGGSLSSLIQGFMPEAGGFGAFSPGGAPGGEAALGGRGASLLSPQGLPGVNTALAQMQHPGTNAAFNGLSAGGGNVHYGPVYNNSTIPSAKTRSSTRKRCAACRLRSNGRPPGTRTA